MRALFVAAVLFAGVTSVDARPLITSSEETYGRICLAPGDVYSRVIAACDLALSEPTITQSQRVEFHVAKAEAMRFSDDPAGARAAYLKAIEIKPSFVRAWTGLGWTARIEGDDAQALEAFDRALGLQVTSDALIGRAASARALGVIDGAEARALLGTALAIEPGDIWAMREIAWSWMGEGAYRDAAAAFADVLEVRPSDPGAHYGAGEAARYLGQYEEALGWFNKAIDLDPTYFAARLQQVTVLRALDRNAQAVRQADQIIADHPERTGGYIERALALSALERRYEAHITLRFAETKLGASNALLYWAADVLSDDGQYEAALGAIERALKLDGAGSADHVLKAYIAIEMDRHELAIEAADAAIALNAESPWAHFYRAVGQARSGDIASAVDAFDSAMDLGLGIEYVTDFAEELYAAGKVDLIAELRRTYPTN
jgi:tetratricopeptide (TPR) repeat protein